ncbi:nucleoside transporter C-terminal domain-containing protein [Hyphomicrobium sp.]|mgnify:CR=1 FL=1|uniref:NupC/NupG family nucleoside CNT transporter n=3 Tax=Hyphomicrobium sp. TaxID=82 RepID=UPI002CE9DDC0|nr:nucleoside transporter C-terminal domain-containing protein [Hyphomicrobium sp.]HRQ27119.1 nucleoside transporter C-terminal domain-containing protein [Hyphomicrobium sp.]
MSLQAQSLLGLLLLPLLAWLLSENRAAFSHKRLLRILVAGIGIQLAIAALMLTLPASRVAFDWAAGLVAALQDATNAGTRLVFGYLAGGPAPFDVVRPENGFVLALQALPLVLVVSALSRLLYHWGILQRVVSAIGRLLQRAFAVTGPVGTASAANIFVGMVEAPLLVRPYLAAMSRGDLFATMSVGMATVAGTVLALYASIIGNIVPGAAGHLMVASVISVPAALMIAALMVPMEPAPLTAHELEAEPVIAVEPAQSSIDAIAQGTRDGVVLLVNVAAMLIVAVSLVALANKLLAFTSTPFGVTLTFEGIVGWMFAPFAWLIGVPWSECGTAGSLIGIKTVVNEFVAYLELAATPHDALSDRTRILMAYALCGFANLGSLGIMIGGMAAMVPERRAEIVGLGAKTVVAGTLATLMTAAAVGVMTPA